MICVYCGEETGDPYDEHERCVGRAAEAALEPAAAPIPMNPTEHALLILFGVIALTPALMILGMVLTYG